MGTFGLTIFMAVTIIVILLCIAGRMLWRHRLAMALAAASVASGVTHLVVSVVAYQQFSQLIFDASQSDVDQWIAAPIAALPTWAYDITAILSIIFAMAAAVTYIINRTKKSYDDTDKDDGASGVLKREPFKGFDEALPHVEQ